MLFALWSQVNIFSRKKIPSINNTHSSWLKLLCYERKIYIGSSPFRCPQSQNFKSERSISILSTPSQLPDWSSNQYEKITPQSSPKWKWIPVQRWCIILLTCSPYPSTFINSQLQVGVTSPNVSPSFWCNATPSASLGGSIKK